MKTKQYATEKPLVQWGNNRKIRNTLKQVKIETQYSEVHGSKSSPKREVYHHTDPLQETGKISNKQPNLPLKGISKRRTIST